MTNSERLATIAHEWLQEETKTHQSMWIWVENRDAGIDLAYKMLKLYKGEFASGDIPYDTLPTYAANAATMNRVFVLSQPNHAEAVLVTMQDDNAQMKSRRISDEEALYAMHLANGRLELPPGEIQYLEQHMSQNEFKPRSPDILFVDVKRPVWELLTQYIGKDTRVLCSPSVEIQPPVHAD